jgi:translation initiation factor 4E
MLAAIGETLEKEGDDEVMGVVVNARKGFYRIGLWTKSCTNTEVLRSIGYHSLPPPRLSCCLLTLFGRRRFKEVLKLPDAERVEFNAHADSERAGGSSRAKTKMTV